MNWDCECGFQVFVHTMNGMSTRVAVKRREGGHFDDKDEADRKKRERMCGFKYRLWSTELPRIFFHHKQNLLYILLSETVLPVLQC